ncbi:MAG: stage II sporulation protein M [Nanoarchaeota archaeon]
MKKKSSNKKHETIFGKILLTLGLILLILSYTLASFYNGLLLLKIFSWSILYIGVLSMFTNQGHPYRKSWKFIKDSKNYIWASIVLFIIFIAIGFIFPVFFREEIFNFIKSLDMQISNLGLLEVIWFIFTNNLKTSFFSIVLGLMLGVFPIVTAIINGYLIGFVSRQVTAEAGLLVLWRLFPHGIFELPAVIISIGMGIRLGFILIWPKKNKKFKDEILDAIRTFVFVILPALVIAGIIEGILVFFLK